MSRVQLALNVNDLQESIAFYRKLGWVSLGPRPHKLPVELMEYRLG